MQHGHTSTTACVVHSSESPRLFPWAEAQATVLGMVPVQAKVLRGRLDGETAVLWIEGRDRDEILRRGRVLLAREDGSWRFKEADLDTVDD